MKKLIIAIALLGLSAYGGDLPQLATRLEAIVIPELTITDQPLNEALNTILAACGDAQTNKWFPGVILNLGDTPEPIVSLQAENISVLATLKRLGENSGLSVTVEEHAVVMKPRK